MTHLLSLALLSIIPLQEPLRDRVDVLWIDHYYSECGHKTFTQLICVDHVDGPGLRTHEEIVAFVCPVHDCHLPVRDGEGGWYVLFMDHGTLRRIEAQSYRETYSQAGVTGDLEIKAREFLPVHERRGLKRAASR